MNGPEEAMILAAGTGRRMRPLTDGTPKALVDVAGFSALERVAAALAGAGVRHLIVNAHHHAEKVASAATRLGREGLDVTVSREDFVSEAPLETGGALRCAAPLFRTAAPFLLHNADVLTDLDLAELYQAHLRGWETDGRLATLVVTRRETARALKVDPDGVYGRVNRTEGWEVIARHPETSGTGEVGFSGIHVVSPRIFALLTERGTFSIIDAYLRLIGLGEVIATYDATDAAWHDIGTPERLKAARAAFRAEGGRP